MCKIRPISINLQDNSTEKNQISLHYKIQLPIGLLAGTGPELGLPDWKRSKQKLGRNRVPEGGSVLDPGWTRNWCNDYIFF